MEKWWYLQNNGMSIMSIVMHSSKFVIYVLTVWFACFLRIQEDNAFWLYMNSTKSTSLLLPYYPYQQFDTYRNFTKKKSSFSKIAQVFSLLTPNNLCKWSPIIHLILAYNLSIFNYQLMKEEKSKFNQGFYWHFPCKNMIWRNSVNDYQNIGGLGERISKRAF